MLHSKLVVSEGMNFLMLQATYLTFQNIQFLWFLKRIFAKMNLEQLTSQLCFQQKVFFLTLGKSKLSFNWLKFLFQGMLSGKKKSSCEIFICEKMTTSCSEQVNVL